MKNLTNAAAEQLLIGSLIANPDFIDSVAEKIGPHDFHDPRIGTIYSAVARLALSGKSGGPALVEELRSSGELDLAGGDKGINTLSSKGTDDPAALKEAVGIVRDLSSKRERAAKAYKVASTLSEGGDAADDINALASDKSVVDSDGWTDLGSVVSAILTGTHRRLEPTILKRHDGSCLLYKGRLNWISAPPESMKSWIAKLACVQLMEGGDATVYVDFEESDGTSCAERIVSICLGRGHSIETVRDWVEGPLLEDGSRDATRRLLYYRAATTGLTGSARSQVMRLVRQRNVPFVVLDGVSSAMSNHTPSLEEDKARDVNLWLGGFAWPLVSLGAGVLCVDHVPKNPQATTGSFAARSPRGSGAKLAAVSGSALSAVVREPGSAWSIGKVDIDIQKDRPGRVKIVTKMNRRCGGTLVSTPTTTGAVETTRLELFSAEEVAEQNAEKRWDLICAELASKALADAKEPMSKGELKELLNERRKAKGSSGWRTQTLSDAIDHLTSKGWATKAKEGKFEMLGHVKIYLAEYGPFGPDEVEENPF